MARQKGLDAADRMFHTASMPWVVAVVLAMTTTFAVACAGAEGGPALPAASPTSRPAAPQGQTPAPGQKSDARYPSDVIDLRDWYLTLPTGKEGDPDDVYQPQLATYTGSDFRLTEARDAVAFTADAGGVTTKGSSYPRSELREMKGDKKADWSNTSGTHTLAVRQAITRLPLVKPHIVAAQIHDAEDDVIEVRLEGERLLVEYDDGDGEVMIDPAYQIGTPYDLKIVAANSRVGIFYNGERKADVPLSGSGWYFKSGSYVQSNPSRGERADAVGQVVIYSLSVTHTG